ncbi:MULTISPECIES: hypothetical protein [unclassified Bradyrhizobium]|uniref:hypothetical protein n=1 Tax=unclassified Bradyrhizobium TaxID=2631580 RepID=UPI0028EF1B9E|nr:MULTISPECIES: hypothetical protein [unclassified Bradyrhizobium]
MSSLAKLCMIGCCSVLAVGSAFGIAHSTGLDVSEAVSAEQPSGSAQASSIAQRPPSRTGNPLWGIPLEQLSATRERPLFSPSRRPPPTDVPPPAVVAAPVVQEPSVPERPQLALVGTVVNGDRGLAVFVDTSSKTPLRIRTGADYRGWTLRLVEARSVTLQRGEDVTVLTLLPTPAQPTNSANESFAQMPSTPTAPPLAQAGPPFLSPESRLLRMHQRQRSGRRQL